MYVQKVELNNLHPIMKAAHMMPFAGWPDSQMSSTINSNTTNHLLGEIGKEGLIHVTPKVTCGLVIFSFTGVFTKHPNNKDSNDFAFSFCSWNQSGTHLPRSGGKGPERQGAGIPGLTAKMASGLFIKVSEGLVPLLWICTVLKTVFGVSGNLNLLRLGKATLHLLFCKSL